MNNIVIGIPRSLFYYKYKYLWTSFFKELQVNILISPHTNKDILNKGRKILNNKLCVPIQIYIGHVNYLVDKTDYILISNSNDNKCYSFLYDIINNILNCKILFINMNKDEEEAFLDIGIKLGFNKQEILNAYKTAKKEEYKQMKINYLLQLKKLKKTGKKVLIISDDFIENDEYIKNDIIKDKNINIFYSNTINPDIKPYKKAIFSNIEHLNNKVNKTIYITTKPCVLKNMLIDDKNIEKIIYNPKNEEINNE